MQCAVLVSCSLTVEVSGTPANIPSSHSPVYVQGGVVRWVQLHHCPYTLRKHPAHAVKPPCFSESKDGPVLGDRLALHAYLHNRCAYGDPEEVPPPTHHTPPTTKHCSLTAVAEN
jgi:hypothetical protein